MAKSKVISSGKMTPVRGGSGHMFGKQTAGTKKPGITGKADSGSGKWTKGGSSKMFGKQTAAKAKAR